MWPMSIVVMHKGCNGSCNMMVVQEQQPIETLGPDRAHEPLGHSVGLGSSIRCAHDLDPFRSKHRVEAPGKLLIAVADQESEGLWPIGKGPRQLSACWVTQAAVGVDVQPDKCTRRLPSSIKNSTYNRCSQIVSTVKKSTASRVRRLIRMNPRQVIPRRVPTGPTPLSRTQLRTVVAETTTPRPFSSPTMR